MRKVDDLGRVCIPIDIRKRYNINENTDLQIIDNGNGIIIYPADRPYLISNNDMETLRKLYIMLKDSGLLDDDYSEKLSKITKESDTKCADCGSNMFLMSDNTYKCYKCN